jgi:hypothetical protein
MQAKDAIVSWLVRPDTVGANIQHSTLNTLNIQQTAAAFR